jgi:adenine-specific DNA methylase
MKRAIEEYFPIVEINRLAVPERNAFKPIYQMHKWFARRASCVFRAILLGCLKPAGTDIMEEFYKDHTNDPDANGKVVLDPFMGGGTTVVEALRLGCKVIGIDLNPVAWFIVKTEVEPVDIDELKAAFDRLANRQVEWSGKSVKETLLDQYKTDCPCCAADHSQLTTHNSPTADIIYTFWVKSAVCTNPKCGKEVPLFSNYVVAQKKPSIRYWRDARCPKCSKTFDWELEPATLIAEPELMRNDGRTSAGELRGNVRWSFGAGDSVTCPWCRDTVTPLPPVSRVPGKAARPERKKVPLTVLLCPHCEAVWQWRGELPEGAAITCPACGKAYDAQRGNVPDKGKFVCPACGTKDAIIASIRRLPEDQLLPMRPYAIEGYCAHCAGDGGAEEDAANLFNGKTPSSKRSAREADHPCRLTKRGGKFFKRVTAADWARYLTACETWQREKEQLAYPRQEIPWGEKTKTHLIGHHYRYWEQMFNARQLLCLSTILAAIRDWPTDIERQMLLSNFQTLVERNSLFCRYYNDRDIVRGMFARHDFHPLNCPAETNVFGSAAWGGTWDNLRDRLVEGKRFNREPFDYRPNTGSGRVEERRQEVVDGAGSKLLCADSRDVLTTHNGPVDLVVTDPPYADNVSYSELADVFYVWLRLALADEFPPFSPELSPKAAEIVENRTRGLTRQDYGRALTEVFRRSAALLPSDGLTVFTFHHREGAAWEVLLQALFDAGLTLVAVYPVHGESESSMHLMGKEAAISYDLIHVCRKRDPSATVEPRSWAGVRQEIRRRAREEIRAIEAGRYGNEPLSPADVNIVLIGKCLELYSRHYGAVIDHAGQPVELHEALAEIRSMVDDLVAKEHPLPPGNRSVGSRAHADPHALGLARR